MGIESKAKILFNEISCCLLHLIGSMPKDKIYNTNNAIKPIHTACLTNNLMKPIPSAKPILPERPSIDMRDNAYPPGYFSDGSGCSYDFLSEKEKPLIDMGNKISAYPPGYFNS